MVEVSTKEKQKDSDDGVDDGSEDEKDEDNAEIAKDPEAPKEEQHVVEMVAPISASSAKPPSKNVGNGGP